MTPNASLKSEELKPCPFCGCAAGYVKHSAGMLGTQGFDKWDAVACKHCRATIGACDRRFRCREDARDAWNRRAAPPLPAVGRQPLTEDRIKEIAKPFIRSVGDHWSNEPAIADNGRIEDFARAIEAAHGIVGTPSPGDSGKGGA